MAQIFSSTEDRQSFLGDTAVGDSTHVAPPARDHHRAGYGVRYGDARDDPRLYGVH